MAEFRPRKIGEYFDIVRKRKWMILLPTLAVGLAVIAAVLLAARFRLHRFVRSVLTEGELK